MNRVKVDSSSIHSVGHDETGLEVQFHAKDCDTQRPGITNEAGDRVVDGPGPCGCAGGDVYHYPGVPAELHQKLMAARSIGSHFTTQVKNAKHPDTGALLYPHVKREAVKS